MKICSEGILKRLTIASEYFLCILIKKRNSNNKTKSFKED